MWNVTVRVNVHQTIKEMVYFFFQAIAMNKGVPKEKEEHVESYEFWRAKLQTFPTLLLFSRSTVIG